MTPHLSDDVPAQALFRDLSGVPVIAITSDEARSVYLFGCGCMGVRKVGVSAFVATM